MFNSCKPESSAIHKNRLQFGVLPIGRGNDFAFGAGVPSDFIESMRLLLDGTFYLMDVGLITGGDFFMAPDGDMSDGLLNLTITQHKAVKANTCYFCCWGTLHACE